MKNTNYRLRQKNRVHHKVSSKELQFAAALFLCSCRDASNLVSAHVVKEPSFCCTAKGTQFAANISVDLCRTQFAELQKELRYNVGADDDKVSNQLQSNLIDESEDRELQYNVGVESKTKNKT